MKNQHVFLILFICFFSLGNISSVSAQEIAKFEKALQNIDSDLQSKQLEYSWLLMESYLTHCTQFNKMINMTKENYLKVLTYEKKPKELQLEEEAYQDAKEKLEKYMRKYDDYVRAENLRKEATTEVARKDASAAISTVYTRLWNEDKKYQEMRNKEQALLKTYRISTVRYMLNEYKSKNLIMPSNIIDYQDRETLLDNNPLLRRLSQEINQLKLLQSQTLRKYQRIKYDLDDSKEL